MPRAPRDKESATPKKRTRKAAPGVEADNGNGAVGHSLAVAPEVVNEPRVSPSLEERIRARAYELYLQRGDRGGSPEQDWLQAQAEICGRQHVA